MQAEEGRRGLIAVALIGGALVLGAWGSSWRPIALGSYAIAYLLNVYLLIRVAVLIERPEKIPGIWVASLFAAFWDAAKIFVLAIVVHWIVGSA